MCRGGRTITVLLLGNGTAPTDRDNAPQSLVNDSAPLNGPFCPRIKYRGVMAPHQDQQSMEFCILALSRQVSSTVLVVALQLASLYEQSWLTGSI